MGKNLRTRMLISLALGIVVVFGLIIYSDFSAMAEALSRFRWQYLPLILALSLSNYFLRFVKWHLYLGKVGVNGLSKRDSFYIFGSGLAMAITPGKVGEWLKCYLLNQSHGTPIGRSTPVIIAERVTDTLAMILLALGGLIAFGAGWQVIAAALALTVGVIALARYRPLALRMLSWLSRPRLLSKWVGSIEHFYESAYVLSGIRNVAWATLLSLASWFGECLGLYLVMLGLGVDGGWMVLLSITFINAVSSLAGALLMLPGGLGATEGGIAGLSQLLLGVSRGLAGAATLIFRLCTLWFAVAFGIAMLLLATRRMESIQKAGKTASNQPAPSPLRTS